MADTGIPAGEAASGIQCPITTRIIPIPLAISKYGNLFAKRVALAMQVSILSRKFIGLYIQVLQNLHSNS